MEYSKNRVSEHATISCDFGVSFSIKQSRDFKIDPIDTLKFLIYTVGFRRFRLMSYWNEHEAVPGRYNFDELDQQINLIKNVGGEISLCLGARQPRWPESHWPKWALKLPRAERYERLYKYIKIVVERYKDESSITSYQLENEALNRSFGTNGDFNRMRLREELKIIKKIDPTKPVIMSTSNTWGIPLCRPIPDAFGFTFYQTQFEKGSYTKNKLPYRWWHARAILIKIITGRRSFIHELQAEPWGPKAIWEMTTKEQDKSMDSKQLKTNIHLAKKTKLLPIDLWGGEWWYWRHLQGDDDIYKTVIKHLSSDEV
jgi:hypothetical protein